MPYQPSQRKKIVMNSIATSHSALPVLEKRFVSSVTLGMLIILIALLFITLAVGSESTVLNLSALTVLIWPALLFVLSWPKDGTKTVKASMRSSNDNALKTAHPNKPKAVEFFPPWLGNSAFNAA